MCNENLNESCKSFCSPLFVWKMVRSLLPTVCTELLCLVFPSRLPAFRKAANWKYVCSHSWHLWETRSVTCYGTSSPSKLSTDTVTDFIVFAGTGNVYRGLARQTRRNTSKFASFVTSPFIPMET